METRTYRYTIKVVLDRRLHVIAPPAEGRWGRPSKAEATQKAREERVGDKEPMELVVYGGEY